MFGCSATKDRGSKLVRRALGLLFDAFNRGQLELGLPELLIQVALSPSLLRIMAAMPHA
jgi:hypothetical protein